MSTVGCVWKESKELHIEGDCVLPCILFCHPLHILCDEHTYTQIIACLCLTDSRLDGRASSHDDTFKSHTLNNALKIKF